MGNSCPRRCALGEQHLLWEPMLLGPEHGAEMMLMMEGNQALSAQCSRYAIQQSGAQGQGHHTMASLIPAHPSVSRKRRAEPGP